MVESVAARRGCATPRTETTAPATPRCCRPMPDAVRALFTAADAYGQRSKAASRKTDRIRLSRPARFRIRAALVRQRAAHPVRLARPSASKGDSIRRLFALPENDDRRPIDSSRGVH